MQKDFVNKNVFYTFAKEKILQLWNIKNIYILKDLVPKMLKG